MWSKKDKNPKRSGSDGKEIDWVQDHAREAKEEFDERNRQASRGMPKFPGS